MESEENVVMDRADPAYQGEPAAKHTRLGRAFLAALNRRGTFSNLDDTEAGLPLDPRALLP